MATFRVCVFGVRAACAGCYHLRLQTKSICDESPAHMGRCSVRTETSLMTTLPTFTNNVFVLNSPRAVSDLQPGVSLLSVDLFVRLPPVARSWSEAEEEKYEVVAGGNVVLNASQLQKFAGCERVSVTVELNGHQPHAQDAVDAPQYEVSLDMMCISGPKWIPTAAGGVREKGLECGVLVAKASSLPLVSDAVGKRQPSCFVAVSTLRDKGKRRPPRGMTAVVPNTSEPAWEEFLQLDLSDCVIARDSLVLDVVDEVSQKSLLECCVPMETVSPGQHHNFNFYSTDGEEPSLTATMHIPLTSNQWESSDDESSGDDNEKLWIAAAVFQTNIAGKEAYNCDGLIARFSISDRKEPPEFPDYNDFMEIDTTQEDHGKVIRKAMKKARKCIPGDFFVDVVPLESRQKGALWPFGHPGMVQCERAAAKHLVIAIYQMYYNPEEGNSKLLGSAALNLNNRGGHLSSSTSLLDTLDLVDKEGVHIGEVSVQVSKTTPDIMKNGNGPATVSRMIGAYGECPYYQKPGMGYAIEWFGLNGNSLKKKLKLTSLSAGQPQASTLAIIVDDMHTKQHALERLQWSMDTVETSCQVYRCRIQDSEMKRKQMSQQLSHLQVLLHKERNAVQSPLSINNPDNKMHKVEDLKEHINKVVTSLHKEKRRNKQLEHQLQHLHNQQVKNLDDRKKHAELEDAHLFQAKQIRGIEEQCKKASAFKSAMKRQEKVIAELQSTICSQRSKDKSASKLQQELDSLRQSCKILRHENQELRQLKGIQEIEALKAQLNACQKGETQARRSREDLDNDRLEAVMRTEKAEAAALAAQNELMEVTKKYAREIAQLKARLAEKDAQLLGGFGTLLNLGLEDACINDAWEKESTSQQSQPLPALHTIPSSSQLIKASGSSGLASSSTVDFPLRKIRHSSENRKQFKNIPVTASAHWEPPQDTKNAMKAVRITTEESSATEESDASYSSGTYSQTTRSYSTSRRTTFETDATSLYTTDEDSEGGDKE